MSRVRLVGVGPGHPGLATVQAAAGIVADSIPEQEFLETRNKASALLQALAAAD